jgi:hypothetical protein
METKEILKRSYYALTIALIMVGVYRTALSVTSHWWPYRYISFVVLLSLGICWVMTRHNKPSHFKWYAGIIVALSLLYIYLPVILTIFRIVWSDIGILKHLLIIGCSVCVTISTLLSNTKYNNILPNQNKGISGLFRVLSWTGQFIVWVYYFIIFSFAVGIVR